MRISEIAGNLNYKDIYFSADNLNKLSVYLRKSIEHPLGRRAANYLWLSE